MNALEKVLEEIKDIKSKAPESRNRDYTTGYLCGLSVAEGIIRSHMDETNEDVFEFDFSNIRSFKCRCGRRYVNTCKAGWIPVSERLPEEYDSIFAKFKGTDKWSNVMFEKKSDEVNVTVEFEDGTRKTGTSYILDGGWRCEKENRFAKQKVVAWQPIPEPYNGE